MAYVAKTFKNGDLLKAEDMNRIELTLASLDKRLSNFYIPITATLSVSPNEAYAGQAVKSVTLTCKTSKKARIVRVFALYEKDGESYENVIYEDTDMSGEFTCTDENGYKSNVTWRFEAIDDEKNPEDDYTKATAFASLTFYYIAMWGVGDRESGYLHQELKYNEIKATTRVTSFEVTPNNQYIYFAVPEALCDADSDPIFIVDKGLPGGFSRKYREDHRIGTFMYRIYRSDHRLTGKTIVDVM